MMSDGTTKIKGVVRYEYANYQHCNWGWNGSYNGWYPEGCFYVNDNMVNIRNDNGEFDASTDSRKEDRSGFYEGPNEHATPTRASDSDVEVINYQYKDKIFINLKPAI